MANNNTAADGSTAGNDIDWANVTLFNDCDLCGVWYDAIEHAHESLCSVCQALFSGEVSGAAEPANFKTIFYTTPEVASPRLKEGEIPCPSCRRSSFRPSSKNNGANCTWCCNKAAREGRDIFAQYGQEMTPQAKEHLQQYHQRLPSPAVTLWDALRSTTQPLPTVAFNTLSTSSAQPAASATESRKRAAEESEVEETTRQNEHTAKRSRTGQRQVATEQSRETTEHSEIIVTTLDQISQQGGQTSEQFNILSADAEETAELGERTAK